MKKRLLFIFILITIIPNILAVCDSGQIDINSASLEELDQLSGIGPVKAQAIIDAREFESIDDLLDVTGIGEITLEKIKDQGLACVEDEEEDTDSNQEEDVQDETTTNDDDAETTTHENDNKSKIITTSTEDAQKITEAEVETIILTPKDIKSETDKEQLDKSKLAIYGLIIFCILLAFLFIFKKRKNKNEFK
jgi:competence ComEA-like helix-hairpin-helix protein